jgi:NADPH:quinone reductase-like Zn-dependent oxidoreductase
VRPVVDRVFPIPAVEEAHQYLKENRHFGKIVLAWE